MGLPLAGLRVLDFGQGVAGPYCGQLLADHGAQVVKVEPPRGDWARTMGAQDRSGMSGTFVAVNRNKRGLCLNLQTAQGADIARRLALKADVIVESFRPGVMARFGLGSAELRAVNPGLVYCSVTGFGPSGPNADHPAGDSIMQAYGGLMTIVGERGGDPLRVGNVVSDMLAGGNAFSGVLLALLARSASGRGNHVAVSLLDSIVAFQAPPLTEFLLTGQAPRRVGNQHPLIAPSGSVRTRDAMINYTVLDHQWPAFCEGLGLAHLVADPRFSSSGARQAHRDELDAQLKDVFASRTTAECIAALRALDILCSPIHDYPALVADPQVRHNALFAGARDAAGREVPMVRSPIRLDDACPSYACPPGMGEHTREILRDELGIDEARIAALVAERVAVCAPLATEPALS